MYKTKYIRKNLSVDMAAMCDVAFLLLVFFVLTAQPKSTGPFNINLPGAASNIMTDHAGNMVFLIIGNGKVFFSIPDSNARKQTLLRVGAKYPIAVSPGQVDIYICADNHELADWITESKKAYHTLYDQEMNFAITADEAVKYPQIKSVMDVLQNRGITKFLLMTTSQIK